MADLAIRKIPSLSDLVAESEDAYKDNALMVILNQDPPSAWLDEHPYVSIKKIVNGRETSVKLPFLPITRIEYLLSRIFTKWWVEVKSVSQIANSVVVIVRLYVVSPVDGSTMWNDGIGATPMQTDKDAGAIEWDKIKSTAVMMAAPSAESYAFKDAAEKFGKLFGKDLGRKDLIDYNNLLKEKVDPATLEEIKQLYDQVIHDDSIVLSAQETANVERVISKEEKQTYNFMRDFLNKKINPL